jgi:integrase
VFPVDSLVVGTPWVPETIVSEDLHTSERITKRVLDALKPSDERTILFDSDLRGFGVRATRNSKTFFVQYRAGSGRTAPKRRLSLGRYGALTVDEARTIARKVLADVARGTDPASEREVTKAAPAVSAFGAEFLTDVSDRRKLSTAREYQRQWDKHVVPALGGKRVGEVTPGDVARLHRSLRSTPYNANRVLALLGSFFTYAEREGLRPKHTNPAHDVEPYKEHSRERFLSPAEVSRLGDALRTAEHRGLPSAPNRRRPTKTGVTSKHRPKTADQPIPANPFAIASIRFLLLTGWREREALNLKWCEVDLSRGVATLPDTKTGRSIRVIGAPACLLLADLPRFEGSEYVFPGKLPNRPLVEINRVWYAGVCRRIGWWISSRHWQTAGSSRERHDCQVRSPV